VHDSIAALMLAANSLVSFYGGDLCYNPGYDPEEGIFSGKTN